MERSWRGPRATPETQPYWDGCGRGQLLLPRCAQCHRLHFFPRGFCPYCWHEDVAWEQVSGRGTVASFVRPQRPVPGFDLEPPFVLALVELEEGVRLMGDVVPMTAVEISVGTRVTAGFHAVEESLPVLRFTPVPAPRSDAE